MSKKQSDSNFAIDLISDAYNTTNPIIIAEKAQEDLNIDLNIHHIEDYLDINRFDYELESRRSYYNINY